MAYRAIEEIGLLFNVKDGMVEAQADFMEIPSYFPGRFIEDFDGDVIEDDDGEIAVEAILDALYYV